VVVVGADHGAISPSLFDHVGQGEAGEMILHVVADIRPYGKQNALSLVVAGPILMGLAKVARHNRPVDGCNNLGEGDFADRSGEDISSADAALRTHQARTLERQQNLLQIGLGESRALRDVANGRGAALLLVERQTQ